MRESSVWRRKVKNCAQTRKNLAAVSVSRCFGNRSSVLGGWTCWVVDVVGGEPTRLVVLASRSVTMGAPVSSSSLSSSTLYEDENVRSPTESNERKGERDALGKLFDPFFSIGRRRGGSCKAELFGDTWTLNSGWMSTFDVVNSPMFGDDERLECFTSTLWLPLLKIVSCDERQSNGDGTGWRFSSVNTIDVSGCENDWFLRLRRSDFGRSSWSQSVAVINGMVVCGCLLQLQLAKRLPHVLLFLKFARNGTVARTEHSANFGMPSTKPRLSIWLMVVVVELISVSFLLLLCAKGVDDIFSIYWKQEKGKQNEWGLSTTREFVSGFQIWMAFTQSNQRGQGW